MNADEKEIVNDALSAYGSSLSDNNFITKSEKTLSVIVASRKNRFYYVSANTGKTLATSAKTIDGVRKFIDDFWMWSKKV
jgi:hypothetical protein